MADRGHELTDELLHGLEERIAGEYAQALADMEDKLKRYLDQFTEDDARRRALVAEGKIQTADYQNWRMRATMMGERWTQMRDVLASDLEHAREIALKLAGEAMPDVYALNGNFSLYQIEHDAQINTGLTLYNHDTAEYLLGDVRQLMPGPSERKAREIAENESMQWDRNKIQSAVLQGILQGESPEKVAKRLMGVGNMSYNAAVRYARTMTTSAQNAGRYNAFHRAADEGVDLVIEWQAVLDGATRHAHRLMHGQRTELDEPFETPDGYTIYYPADCSGVSDAPQEEIWNCRCTLLAWVRGFEGETVTHSPGMGDLTFEEWQNMAEDREEEDDG